MSRQIINIGTTDDDGTGDPVRSAFNKCNENFTEIYANTDGVLQTAWTGTAVANAAFSIAVIGTNSAAHAELDALTALRTAWSGTAGANQAFAIAVAGTAAAAGAALNAQTALQTAWSGTAGAAQAFALAVAGTTAAAQANTNAVAALNVGFTGTAAAQSALSMAQNGTNCGFSFVIDGGGAAITTGLKGYLEVPFSMYIKRWTIVADQSGNAVVDVLKSNGFAGFPTVPSIAASAKPTLTGAQKNQDTTLTGWTKQINAGDVVGFTVNSAATCQIVTVAIAGTRTP